MNMVERGQSPAGQRTRADWSLLLGRIVEISLAVPGLGFDDADDLLKSHDGRARGRVLGVDAGGFWFEFIEHTEAAQNGRIPLDEVPHFYVSYNSLRSARATAMSVKKSTARSKVAATT